MTFLDRFVSPLVMAPVASDFSAIASVVAIPARAPLEGWSEATPKLRFFGGKPPVGKSEDLTRILNLFRRPPVDLDSARGEAIAELMTSRLSRGPQACACKLRHITRLKPVQAWALYEAPLAGGLVGSVTVGGGKTILDVLTIMVMNVQSAVLLIPPGLKQQLWDDYQAIGEHFHVPSIIYHDQSHSRIFEGRPKLYVLPYSQLSRPKSTDLLRQLAPDLIIADELQKLAHMSTATVARFFRYFREKPETKFCGWSGTLTKDSIKNFAHLLAIALGEGSPLPIDPQVVEEWAAAIDPAPDQGPEGELTALMQPGESLYQGVQRRLTETRGFVSTRGTSIDASLNLYEFKVPPLPEKIKEMLVDVRDKGERPDGWETFEEGEKITWAKQLACGFYYKWVFPKGTPSELIDEWYAARKAWNRELRVKLVGAKEGLDSPHLCYNAAARAWQPGGYDGPLPVWRADNWKAWADIKDRVTHTVEPVWVDDFFLNAAVEWAKKHRGVVWYEYRTLGERLAKLLDVPLQCGGPTAEARLKEEFERYEGSRPIVASIEAHGTGRNGFQLHFHEQAVLNPMSSGDGWGQLLGRLHRPGQTKDEVSAWVPRHTPEVRRAIDKAVIKAKYMQGVTGAEQILLNSTCEFALIDD